MADRHFGRRRLTQSDLDLIQDDRAFAPPGQTSEPGVVREWAAGFLFLALVFGAAIFVGRHWG